MAAAKDIATKSKIKQITEMLDTLSLDELRACSRDELNLFEAAAYHWQKLADAEWKNRGF